jgi:hypothetical protein
VGTEAEYADSLKEFLQSNRLTVIQARSDPNQYPVQFDLHRDLQRLAVPGRDEGQVNGHH